MIEPIAFKIIILMGMSLTHLRNLPYIVHNNSRKLTSPPKCSHTSCRHIHFKYTFGFNTVKVQYIASFTREDESKNLHMPVILDRRKNKTQI